jgi:hypothetical protein
MSCGFQLAGHFSSHQIPLSQSEADPYVTLKAGIFSEVTDVYIPRIFMFYFGFN